MVKIKKLLVANRGEIAVRVFQTARAGGIQTVAVYSDADAGALHVTEADEAVCIGPAPSAESYLRGDAIIAAAKKTDADAIHPGYGFLSENPAFAEAVVDAGLIFIGPSANAIRAMGLKDGAKALMQEAGVPVVPGYHGVSQDFDLLAAEAVSIGYPVLIKARAGGGGKGMRLVEDPADFAAELAAAQREAEKSFGDPSCLIEKYITQPRHIEIQIFGDADGNVVHMFERDCSLQRRHQKVLEEAPAPDMPETVRAAMGAAAVRAAQAVNYVGAGTVEFIADGSGPLREDGFWFMEMNTRLQVEHPVTELITGLDLVALQIAVAEGAALPFSQNDLAITGHAVEARLYAEDPGAGFLPATGRLAHLRFPAEVEGLRIDAGVRSGDAVLPHYDPMIAKVITYAPTRGEALRRLAAALDQTQIFGLVTNRAFLARLARDPDVVAGRVDTGLIARKGDQLTLQAFPTPQDYAIAAIATSRPPISGDSPFEALQAFRHFGPARRTIAFEGAGEVTLTTTANGIVDAQTPAGPVTLDAVVRDGDELHFVLDGVHCNATVLFDDAKIGVFMDGGEMSFQLAVPGSTAIEVDADTVTAPMPGAVIEVMAKGGQTVTKGTPLLVLEAMKMEHRLIAPRDGQIATLTVSQGDQVEQGAILVSFVAEEEA
ncbi:MAG: biotin carboxylase N-terminal domain-containing protein [Pseudomonadota bacterium]